MIYEEYTFINEDETDENEQNLDTIVETLRNYPFIEKMSVCQNCATQIMDITKLSFLEKSNVVYPWELEVFAEFSLFADGNNVVKSFADNNGDDFVDMINIIRNYQHPFLEKQKNMDFANAFIMVTGLQQFKFQENILYRLYRYKYFWNFVNRNIDMPSVFSEKFGGQCYKKFCELATLIFFYASLKTNAKAVVEEILIKYIDIINYLKITREEYKSKQSDKNDDNYENAIYNFNYLHSFPFIEHLDLLFLPLPYLVIDAVTDSLLTRATYNNNHLREIIGKEVAQSYIESIFRESNTYGEVVSETEYRIRKRKIDSPDIMIKDQNNFCFIDTKLSTPKLEIRKFNQEEINNTINRYAKCVVQMYNRIKEFLNGFYYPFVENVVVDKQNTFGIVAVLEEAYISRRQIYSEAMKILCVDPESDEAKFIQEHIKFTNFKDLESFAFHSQNIFVALKEKAKNPKDWNDMGLYNSQYYGDKESNRITSLEKFISENQELIVDYINEMVSKGIIPKNS